MDNKYIADFQILGSSIRSLKIRNDFIKFSPDDKMKRKIDVSHQITSLDTTSDESSLMGTLLLNIKVTVSSGKKKYVLEVSIEGCFSSSREIGEEKFSSMMVLNGITSLYSIARGFVQSTTAQTLVSGAVLLPLFNVAAYSQDVNKKQ